MRYAIWSIEHDAWWAPGSVGYTRVLDEAGAYSDENSRQIVERANVVKFHECRIPLECLRHDPAEIAE